MYERMSVLALGMAITLRPRLRLLGSNRWLRLGAGAGAVVFLVTAAINTFLIPAALPGAIWQSAGLSGILVHSISFSQSPDRIVFVGTEQGVYRRVGSGPWRQVVVGQIWSVEAVPRSHIVLAGDQQGHVDVSRDLGTYWRRELVDGQGVYSVAGLPGGHILLAGGGGGIYRSVDGGLDWKRALSIGSSAVDAFTEEREGTRERLYAGAVAGGSRAIISVFVSSDNGRTWKQSDQDLGAGAGVMSLTAIEKPPYVFAGTMGHAVWRTSQTAGRWLQVANGMPVNEDHGASLLEIPGSPATLFVGTLGQGIFQSSDAGRIWKNVSSDLQRPGGSIVLALGYDPDTSLLYAGTASGLFKTRL